MNNNISVQELSLINNPTIVDIREYYYFSLGHIPNAISIPYYNLLNNFSHYLKRYSTYYLYCETGEQSNDLVERLNSFGYNTLNIIGGYQAYLKVFG